MFKYKALAAMFSGAIVLSLIGCSASQVDVVEVTPSTQTLTTGQTAQLSASGIIGHGTHPSTTVDVTNTITWASSVPAIASVGSTGLVTAVSAGTATVTATMKGFTGAVSGTSTITVVGSKGTSVSALQIIPNSQSVLTVNETNQYIAIGTTTGGTQVDLTNQVAWASSDVKVATINSSGLATGLNAGSSTVSAVAKNSDGSVLTATATFTEQATGSGTQLATVTVYKVGNNAQTGHVTAAAPGTTTPLVIDCGTGAGCVAHFPVGATVTLEADANGSSFGGWSSECVPTAPIDPSPTGKNYCTLTIPTSADNMTVGAIFN
jgi:hypothetical protein